MRRCLRLVHDMGGVAEAERLAEVEHWRNTPPGRRCWPAPEVTPRRVVVSCDGIVYCTSQTAPANGYPDPQRPGASRLIWRQMRVGTVAWQDARDRWHKRVVWGQEEDFRSFGAALDRLACRCGYRQAEERLFSTDGGEWCWSIRQQYFADAAGILDWYHASEHLWQTARTLAAAPAVATSGAQAAETLLYEQGGMALLRWLLAQRGSLRGGKRRALDGLIGYLQPKLDRTDYPRYRAQGWLIGTGLIESTARQLVGLRLKGPGMHWCPHGATAITALRAQDLNGRWHAFWKSLTLAQ